MPSPIAHISVGYVIYCCLRSKWQVASGKWQVCLLALCAFLSLLPDMDCIPGLFIGDLDPFHNYYSHSVIVLLLASIPLAFVVRYVLLRFQVSRLPSRRHGFRFRYIYAFTLCCVLLHVAMDVLGYGVGQMLFWPITGARFKLPFYIFYGLHWSEGWWSIRHVWTILTEGLFAVGIIVATHRCLKRR
jgi:hypothetical protein